MPYLCGECGKRFDREHKFIQHTQRVHGEKIFDCQFCDNSFPTKGWVMRYQTKSLESVHNF